ncbi:Hypothetical predicted protein [Paramuricea clavata]|uniref:Uncharacterized protein n=1 Tax=Paramuricea clavata TaxID=317549 RepID=A0A6S7I3U3_PARCT|nr:Hypothetical predicted protein [Paramuricea clavata]
MKGWKECEFKNLLGMYHKGKEYDRLLDCLVMIAGVVDEMDGVKIPLTKIMIVRICSMLGIEVRIADASLWEPSECKYYRRWLIRNLGERKAFESMNLEEKTERYSGRRKMENQTTRNPEEMMKEYTKMMLEMKARMDAMEAKTSALEKDNKE